MSIANGKISKLPHGRRERKKENIPRLLRSLKHKNSGLYRVCIGSGRDMHAQSKKHTYSNTQVRVGHISNYLPITSPPYPREPSWNQRKLLQKEFKHALQDLTWKSSVMHVLSPFLYFKRILRQNLLATCLLFLYFSFFSFTIYLAFIRKRCLCPHKSRV